MKANKINKSILEIKKRYALKYLELSKKIPKIVDFNRREFAFFHWDKNYMIRHRSYQNPNDFIEDLKNSAPRHVYASAAIYQEPDVKNMSKKGWLGCDFIVDIDSDHFNLDCQKDHDYHFCQDPHNQDCDYYNNGPAPQECPKCGANKFKKQLWLCDECLDVSKKELIKLIDNFLIPDFGYSLEQIEIVFSGHRGYHLHIYDEKIRKLKSEQRRQIVDYFTGTGFIPSRAFKMKPGGFIGSKTSDIGWKGKIARKMYESLTKLNQDEIIRKLQAGGIGKNMVELFTNDINVTQLMNYLEHQNQTWNIQGMGQKTWAKIITVYMDEIKCDLDIPVSIDVHRLIRLTGSIHGKTGFLVQPIEYNQLKDFDPFSNPVIFSFDEKQSISTKITTQFCPKIRIKDETYGPYNKGEKIIFPEAVSLFFVCKGIASIIE